MTSRAHLPDLRRRHPAPREPLQDAARLLAGAERALRLAVAAERLQGASWAQSGDALGVTRQSAHERYAPFEREVRHALLFARRAGAPGERG